LRLQCTDPRVTYTLGVIADGCDVSAWISYGCDCAATSDAKLRIVPSGLFGPTYGTPASLPKLPLPEVEGVPVLFGTPRIERRGDTLIVHADIIASAYFLLTRYEEWVCRDVRDEHGRFPGRKSLPYRAGFIDRPVVDEYAALLRKWAREVGIDMPESKRKFSVSLTHDVDVINVPRGPTETVRSLGSGVLARRPWRAALKSAGASLGLCQDPLDNLEDVIDLDAKLMRGESLKACRSIYFFMAGGNSRFDGMYNIRSPRAQRWIESVKAAGGQIGLHASYDAGMHPELVAKERQALEECTGVPITMNRHHYLRWREPEHGHQVRAAGITWDSTLGYADVAGFRLGTCRPVALFCPLRQQPLGIQEHPLTLMDCTLSNAHYMNLDEEAAFEYARRLVDATHHFQGEFVALWHNSRVAITCPIYRYHCRLYSRLLDYLAPRLQ
jgi:uncharacterized protein DUF7033